MRAASVLQPPPSLFPLYTYCEGTVCHADPTSSRDPWLLSSLASTHCNRPNSFSVQKMFVLRSVFSLYILCYVVLRALHYIEENSNSIECRCVQINVAVCVHG